MPPSERMLCCSAHFRQDWEKNPAHGTSTGFSADSHSQVQITSQHNHHVKSDLSCHGVTVIYLVTWWSLWITHWEFICNNHRSLMRGLSVCNVTTDRTHGRLPPGVQCCRWWPTVHCTAHTVQLYTSRGWTEKGTLACRAQAGKCNAIKLFTGRKVEEDLGKGWYNTCAYDSCKSIGLKVHTSVFPMRYVTTCQMYARWCTVVQWLYSVQWPGGYWGPDGERAGNTVGCPLPSPLTSWDPCHHLPGCHSHQILSLNGCLRTDCSPVDL